MFEAYSCQVASAETAAKKAASLPTTTKVIYNIVIYIRCKNRVLRLAIKEVRPCLVSDAKNFATL